MEKVPAEGAVLPPRLLDELRYIVGPLGVLTAAEDTLAYECDAYTNARATPSAVVFPETKHQVADVVRALSRERVPYLGRGAGTGLAGGACPVRGGAVISLAKLDRIIAIDIPAGFAVVEPGVVNIRLTRAVEGQGYLFAPDPGSQVSCTIGGNAACNSGGPHTLKYGVTTNHVLGLEVVLPDGEAVILGGPAEDSPGLDMRGLQVGSEGTLGIVTRIWVRLTRAPVAFRTLMAPFPTFESACQAVSNIIAAGIVPAALELMDQTIVAAVEKTCALGLPLDAGAILIIELDGMPDGLARVADRTAALCRDAGAAGIRTARNSAERVALWIGRRKAASAIGRLAPAFCAQDVVVPRSRLSEYSVMARELERKHGLSSAYLLHAGDGNVHPNVLYDYRVPEQIERMERLTGDMINAAIDLGGSVSGEHGIGVEKKEFLRRQFGEDTLAVMREIKDLFDPRGLCNPDKVLPPAVEGGRTVPGEPAADAGKTAASPASIEEAAEILYSASAAGRPVLIAGGGCFLGTSTAMGHADLTVNTGRLADPVFYEPGELVVKVRAGMTLENLRRMLAERGQEVPWDYPWPGRQTVGGIVASGVAGPRRLLFGAPRDHVLGVTAVRSDGRIIRPGGRVVKNMAGYDLTRLLVGSRGALGLIAEVALRVKPVSEDGWMATMDFANARELAVAVEAVLSAGVLVSFLEAKGRWGAYALAVGCEGLREQAAVQREKILAALKCGRNITEWVFASVGPFLEEWTRQPWDAPGPVIRVSVPRSALVRVLDSVEGPVYANAGSGVIRVAPGRDLSPVEARDLLTRLNRLAAVSGGWAVMERGPFSGVMPDAGPRLNELGTGIRRAFDPAGCFRSGGKWL